MKRKNRITTVVNMYILIKTQKYNYYLNIKKMKMIIINNHI